MSLCVNWMSACIGFVLFNPRQHPIKLSRGYLSAAEFTNAGIVYLERRATVRTIQVCLSRSRLGIPAANKRPVFTPGSEIGLGTTNDVTALVNGVIVALRSDSQRDRIVKLVFRDLHWLQRGDLALVERVAQVLPLESFHPILMHLKQVVGFMRPRSLPVEC